MKTRPTRDLVDLARTARQHCQQAAALLIVNDRADVAKLIDADGVHLGQDDLPPTAARQWLGPNAIIGVSTHSLDQARGAVAQGVADYLGFGPVYATSSKLNPDPVQGITTLRKVCAAVPLPVVAIGGITTATVAEVLAAGASSVAMIGELARAANPETKLAELLLRAPACA